MSNHRRFRALPNVLSVIFHPLLMPVAGTMFILFCSGMYITFLPVRTKEAILLIVGSCTLALPIALSLVLRIFQDTGKPFLSKRIERIMTLMLTAIFYYIAYRVLHTIHTPHVMQKLVLSFMITTFAASVISWRWDISIYGAGAGVIAGMTAALATAALPLLLALTAAIILSGMVGYARIRLNAHSPVQYYAGNLLGFALTFGTFSLL
jgi:membrane-associated phospholipid phosphatase